MSATAVHLAAPSRPRGAAPSGLAARTAFAVLFVAALALGVRWQGLATLAMWAPFVLADLPLMGMRPGGVLGPRWIPIYNAIHALPGPVALATLAAVSGSALLGAVALGWLAHVCMDRAAGYGMRTRDGRLR
jgi:hypothetical protein